MYKISIFSVGKTKESWLVEALSEYEGRLRSQVEIEWILVQLHDWLEARGSRLVFLIGGAEGISPSLLSKAFAKISFSKMTLTHQMVRLLLLEQIYRAVEIRKGTGYHK
jgi:23S rRNA (pseudouridine1915-N3)-methyltransferase